MRQIGYEEALGLYDLRAVIFGFACESLARRRSAAEIALLEDALAEMQAALGAGDRARYYQLNVAFHAMVLERSGHRRAVRRGRHAAAMRRSLPDAATAVSSATRAGAAPARPSW